MTYGWCGQDGNLAAGIVVVGTEGVQCSAVSLMGTGSLGVLVQLVTDPAKINNGSYAEPEKGWVDTQIYIPAGDTSNKIPNRTM